MKRWADINDGATGRLINTDAPITMGEGFLAEITDINGDDVLVLGGTVAFDKNTITIIERGI